MIGQPAFTGTVVIQNVAEPKLTLHQKAPDGRRWQEGITKGAAILAELVSARQ
jgi:hypothetical protein